MKKTYQTPSTEVYQMSAKNVILAGSETLQFGSENKDTNLAEGRYYFFDEEDDKE